MCLPNEQEQAKPEVPNQGKKGWSSAKHTFNSKNPNLETLILDSHDPIQAKKLDFKKPREE